MKKYQYMIVKSTSKTAKFCLTIALLCNSFYAFSEDIVEEDVAAASNDIPPAATIDGFQNYMIAIAVVLIGYYFVKYSKINK